MAAVGEKVRKEGLEVRAAERGKYLVDRGGERGLRGGMEAEGVRQGEGGRRERRTWCRDSRDIAEIESERYRVSRKFPLGT